jgi:competence ComEA-like helix-hairpin-helix protein
VIVAAVIATFVIVASHRVRAGGKDMDGVVNLNTAPQEMLSLLPGVGPSKARGILAYRSRHPFRTVDELVRVKGIGRRMVREMRTHLAVAGPSTAHAAAGVRAIATPLPVSVALPPARLCRPAIAVPPRSVPAPRPPRGPQNRSVRSATNHCVPPA